jgi:hypothetical protein
VATSPFKLTPVGAAFAGKTGDQVTISVVQCDPADPAPQLEDVRYPGATAVKIASNKAQFSIVNGANDLSVTIGSIVPPICWKVVEIGSDGTTQDLAFVNQGGADPDPDNTSVRIKGAKG